MMQLRCIDLMDELMKKVLQKSSISDLWLLDHGNPGNKPYFSTRIKKNPNKPFNEQAITRMLDCFRYHFGINKKEANIIPEDQSSLIANRLLEYFNSYGIEMCLDLTNKPDDTNNPYYREGLLCFLELLLDLCLNKESIDIDEVNLEFKTNLSTIDKMIRELITPSLKVENNADIISELLGRNVIDLKPATENKFINSIPACVKHFVGRNDYLKVIHRELEQSGYAILEGIGGIGKSELAKKYLYEYRNEYEDTIWISYNKSIKNTICNIPFAEDALIEKETTAQKYERKLKKLLNYESDLLIIIDNYDTYNDDILNFIGYKFDVIITTRTHYFDDSISITPLSEDDSLKLFTSLCRKYRTTKYESTICMILKTINYHTLLIELVARNLSLSNLTPDKMLSMLSSNLIINDETEVPIYKDNKRANQQIEKHIDSLFRFNQKELTEKDVEIALQNCSLIPNSGLLLADYCFLLGFTNNNNINKLVALGWLALDDDGYINTHQLIKDAVARHYLCTDSNILIYTTFINNSNLLLTNQAYINDYDERHIASISDYVLKLANSFKFNNEGWTRFLLNGSYYLGEFHRFEDAISIAELAIPLLDSVNFSNPATPALFYSNIASLYEAICNYSVARELQKKATDLFESIPNKESINNYTAIKSAIYNTNATLAFNAGDFEGSRQIYENDIDLSLISDSTITNIYRVLGDLDKAEEMAKQNLQVTIEHCGEISKEAAVKYGNLGVCLASKQDTSAFLYHEKAISILDELNYVDTIEKADAYHLYAATFAILHNPQDAMKYIEKSIDIYNKYPNIPNDTLMEVYNLAGECYTLVENYELAEKYYIDSIKLYETIYPNRLATPTYACYLYQLGILYYKTNNPEAFVILHQCCNTLDSLSDTRAVYFPEFEPYVHLAAIYANFKKYDKSYNLLSRAEKYIKQSSTTDQTLWDVYFKGITSNINISEGNLDDALKNVNSALSIFDKNKSYFYSLYNDENITDLLLTKFSLLYLKALIFLKKEDYDNYLDIISEATNEYKTHPLSLDDNLFMHACAEHESILLVMYNSTQTEAPHLLYYEENMLDISNISIDDIMLLCGLSRLYKNMGNNEKSSYYKQFLE